MNQTHPRFPQEANPEVSSNATHPTLERKIRHPSQMENAEIFFHVNHTWLQIKKTGVSTMEPTLMATTGRTPAALCFTSIGNLKFETPPELHPECVPGSASVLVAEVGHPKKKRN